MTGFEALLKDINTHKQQWEGQNMTLRGIRNLSLSDLESLELYAEAYATSGGYSFAPYQKPLGAIADVLSAYGLTVASSSLGW